MLCYIRDSRAENATDAATKEIHGYAERVKVRPEVRKNYMFWEEYEELLREKIADAIREDIRNEVLEEFNDAEKDKIREKLRDSVKEDVCKELMDTVKEDVRKELMDTVKEDVRKELMDTVKEDVRKELMDTMKDEIQQAGKVEAILELLEEYGEVPAKLQEKIHSENDMAVLKCWLKIAAKVNSVEEFEKEIK